MGILIKASSEIKKNYRGIADLARSMQVPVFLTRNGEADTVLMDMQTYQKREDDLALAQRLVQVEKARLEGTEDYSIEDFAKNVRNAIEQASKRNE